MFKTWMTRMSPKESGLLSIEPDGGGVGLGGGPSSAPSSSPEPASPPSGSPSSDPTQSALNDMISGWQGGSTRETAPPPTPVVPAPVVPSAPPQVPAVGPQMPATQPVAPQAAPLQPAPPVAPQGPAAPTQPALTPQQQQQAWQETRNTVRQQIASSYSLSPDRALQMATEPERVLPEMAADITLNAYEATMQTLSQQLPQLVMENPQIRQQMGQMVGGVIQQMFQAYTAEQEFFAVNQDLRQVPKADIDRISAMYIQHNRNNPSLTRETANREIGILIRNMLGMSPATNTPGPLGQPPAAPPVVQPPSTPYAQPGNIVARTPIGPGTGSSAPSAPRSIWEEMVAHARHQ